MLFSITFYFKCTKLQQVGCNANLYDLFEDLKEYFCVYPSIVQLDEVNVGFIKLVISNAILLETIIWF